MKPITRRHFGGLVTAGTALLAAPAVLRAAGRKRVVVIGGGAGGASAAQQLAAAAGDRLDIVLIEPSEHYTTCFSSNLFIGGERDFAALVHGYDALVSEYRIAKLTTAATAIDKAAHTVSTADGQTVSYDRLIVAPGIDFIWDSVPGYSEAAADEAPHAWKAGPQTRLLKEKLDRIGSGEQVVIVPPPNPYRCPPAPYERASMMAHSFKKRGVDARIIIIDPKDKFSKQGLFQQGWETHYPGMVEWYGPDIHGGILGVDVANGAVETDFDTFQGALLNIIPAQQAGAIAVAAGLAAEGAFCPVEGETMRSIHDRDIFVIGDAADAGPIPKGAFAANSQARVAAQAILAELDGRPLPEPHYANACWSVIETGDAVRLAAEFAVRDGAIVETHSTISQNEETPDLRRSTYEDALGWYEAFTGSIFGG